MSKVEPVAGERLASQFTPEQRGWIVAALVAFLGIVYVGPSFTRAAETSKTVTKRTAKRIRQLGGGTIARVRRRF